MPISKANRTRYFLKKLKGYFKNRYFILGIIVILLSIVYYTQTSKDEDCLCKENFTNLGIVPESKFSKNIINDKYKYLKNNYSTITKYSFNSKNINNSLSIHFPKVNDTIYFYIESPNMYILKKFIKVPKNGIIKLTPKFKYFSFWVLTKDKFTLKNGIVNRLNTSESINNNIYVLKDGNKITQTKTLITTSKDFLFPRVSNYIINHNYIQLLIAILFITGVFVLAP